MATKSKKLVALTTFHVSVGGKGEPEDEDYEPADEYFVREGQKLPADHPAVKQSASLFSEVETSE
jgi:hypothetical protein